jgi:hypothetical protein
MDPDPKLEGARARHRAAYPQRNEEQGADEEGESVLLLECPRGPRNDPGAEVVRWELGRYEGHPYIQGRAWFRGQDGAMHPTRRGVTLRAGELVNAIKALCGAARSMGLLPARDDRA